MAKRIKSGGRKQGTPNKLNSDLRERISDFLNNNWKQVENDFKNLEPEKRILLFEKLLSFILPKLQTIQTPDIKVSNTPIQIVFKDFQKENELTRQTE